MVEGELLAYGATFSVRSEQLHQRLPVAAVEKPAVLDVEGADHLQTSNRRRRRSMWSRHFPSVDDVQGRMAGVQTVRPHQETAVVGDM